MTTVRITQTAGTEYGVTVERRPRSRNGRFTRWQPVRLGPGAGNNNVLRRCDVRRDLNATFGTGKAGRRWMIIAEYEDRRFYGPRLYWLLHLDTGRFLQVSANDVGNLY